MIGKQTSRNTKKDPGRYRRIGTVMSPKTHEDFPQNHARSTKDWEVETPKSPRKKLGMDRTLLVAEIIALIVFVALIIYGWNAIRNLNKEAVAYQSQSLNPQSFLPSGHTSPNLPGGAQPVGESDQALPGNHPASYSQVTNAVRIEIPSLEINAPVVQGDGWEELKLGVGQHLNTAIPGEPGNMVLSAHNDIFGEIFRHLDKLQKNDKIIIHTANQSFVYVVSETVITKPSAVEYLEPTPLPTLTLISCYPYLIDNKRIVVLADLATGIE